jgi:hypothetical protein
MPLDTFCGEARCVDVRRFPAGYEVTVGDLEQALTDAGSEFRKETSCSSARTTTTAPPERPPS